MVQKGTVLGRAVFRPSGMPATASNHLSAPILLVKFGHAPRKNVDQTVRTLEAEQRLALCSRFGNMVNPTKPPLIALACFST